ncbi:MAG: type III pantothenate kinase [Elusimicrobia bacterium]|nr:type III pantothenate kinase [Elusimicrobiota bacterium]
MKLLAVDIGNTTINFGFFENGKLISKRKVLSGKFNRIPYLGSDRAIISSVVPSLTSRVGKKLKKPVVVNYKNVRVEIKLKNPKQVGTDRLVNVVAANELYGTPSIVIDTGTATTFDVISEKGEYLGGVIAPGIKMSAGSLYERTAKLPKVEPRIPDNVIGKNTEEAILSGIFYGHIGLIKEVVERIKGDFSNSKKLKIILTGGYSNFISKYFSKTSWENFIVDEDLTLQGLKIVFENLQNK